MGTAAQRQQRHRSRQREGRAIVAIEIDLVETEELLVAAELLSEHDRDDRGKVELAVGRLIELLIAVENG